MKKKLFLWLQSIIRTLKLYDITERGVAGFSFEFAEYPTRRLLYPSIRRLRLGVFYKDQGFKVGGRDRCRYMSIEPSRVSKKCNILLLWSNLQFVNKLQAFSFWEHSLQRVPSSRASQLCLCLLMDFLKEAASGPPALPGDKLTFQFFVQWRVVLCSKGPCIVQSHHLKSSDMTWSLVKDQAQSDYILERAHVLDDLVRIQLKWMVGKIAPSFFCGKITQYRAQPCLITNHWKGDSCCRKVVEIPFWFPS